MARILWLLGTIVVGSAIAVGSWFGVRELTRTVQAAAPGDDSLLAQNSAVGQNQPMPRTAPRPAANANDSEAPADTSPEEQPETFIGALRKVLDGADDIGMDKDAHLKSLDEAEAAFKRIKQENRTALERVNRRPPISIPQSPNFIVIDMYGLGYTDLAAFSKEAKADQQIDALAETGLVFTHFYAASASPVANTCALLTGLHTGRARIRGDAPVVPLALDDVTIAEVLWRAGYSTGMYGQWRLGGGDSSGAPTRQGFEEAWYTANAGDEASPIVWNGDRRLNDGQQPTDWNELRTTCFAEATSFVNRHRKQPVFLYLSLPVDAADTFAQADEQVGKLTKAINDMKLARETYFFLVGTPGKNLPASAAPVAVIEEALPAADEPVEVAKAPPAIPLVDTPQSVAPAQIIPGAKAPADRPEPTNKVIETDFSQAPDGSDNAAEAVAPANDPTDNAFVEKLKHREPLNVRTAKEVAGLKGALGEMFEGGLRAPLIVWTSKRPLGGVRNDVVAAWDLLPTLASLSYSQFIPTYINGESFAARLQVHGDTSFLPLHTALYWESYGDSFNRAFLYGKWKLIQIGQDGPVELYNLELDPQESRNVADRQPELVEKLLPLLDRVRSESRLWRRAGEPAVEPAVEPARAE